MTMPDAVLLMAYGTPEQLSDVPDYFTHIRGGRRPSDEAIADLTRRYTKIGGSGPLREITESVRDGLQSELQNGHGGQTKVYVGMKHWHPFIAETLQQMRDDGVKTVVALALAPHYSRMSVGAYQHAVNEAAEALGNPFDITFVNEWYDAPAFIDAIADRIRAVTDRPDGATTDWEIVFTAHSLPIRIREWNDPYERQLHESAALVANRLGVKHWRFAWQSAGGSREPWIGPDILDFLPTLKSEAVRHVLQVPIGFVSDHLEILYDIDVEAKERARELGMHLERTQLPNASPDFIKALAAVVHRAVGRDAESVAVAI